MTSRSDAIGVRARFLRAALGLLPGLALLLAVVAGGVHHHTGADGSRPCAICSLSHIPATATVAASGSAPVLRVESVTLEPELAARSTAPATPCSRAPPSS